MNKSVIWISTSYSKLRNGKGLERILFSMVPEMNLIEEERIPARPSLHSANDNSTSVKPTANLRHSAVMHRNEADKRGDAARVRETIVAASGGGQQRVRFARTRTRWKSVSQPDAEMRDLVRTTKMTSSWSGIGERAHLGSASAPREHAPMIRPFASRCVTHVERIVITSHRL